MRYISLFNTDWGHVRIEADENEILSISGVFEQANEIETIENQWTRKAKLQMQEYFLGKRTEFDLPLKFRGTEFQNEVWKALLTIPFGTLVSYKDVCRKINREKACQAVGTAVGKNPFFVVVPCHRVIASNGGLGGYALGLDLKRYLLKLEGNAFENSK